MQKRAFCVFLLTGAVGGGVVGWEMVKEAQPPSHRRSRATPCWYAIYRAYLNKYNSQHKTAIISQKILKRFGPIISDNVYSTNGNDIALICSAYQELV